MIQKFCEWIVASGNLDDLVIGTSLFAGTVPADIEETSTLYTCVLERTGPRAEEYLPNAREVVFQLFTRGNTYFTARTEAYRLFEWLIAKRAGISLTGWFIYAIVGNAPGYIGVSENGKHDFSTNMILRVRKET